MTAALGAKQTVLGQVRLVIYLFQLSYYRYEAIGHFSKKLVAFHLGLANMVFVGNAKRMLLRIRTSA